MDMTSTKGTLSAKRDLYCRSRNVDLIDGGTNGID